MVNGLWGWQQDWKQMRKALEAANKDGRLFNHVSAVNTGAHTCDGVSTGKWSAR